MFYGNLSAFVLPFAIFMGLLLSYGIKIEVFVAFREH
jgi:hypothetical protein